MLSQPGFRAPQWTLPVITLRYEADFLNWSFKVEGFDDTTREFERKCLLGGVNWFAWRPLRVISSPARRHKRTWYSWARWVVKHLIIFGGKNHVGARCAHVTERVSRFWREALAFVRPRFNTWPCWWMKFHQTSETMQTQHNTMNPIPR